jgi:hypothetical protein
MPSGNPARVVTFAFHSWNSSASFISSFPRIQTFEILGFLRLKIFFSTSFAAFKFFFAKTHLWIGRKYVTKNLEVGRYSLKHTYKTAQHGWQCYDLWKCWPLFGKRFGDFLKYVLIILCAYLDICTRVARFIFVEHTKIVKKWPNNHKTYQMSIKYNNWPLNRPNVHKRCQRLSLQDPQKFTQMGIFLFWKCSIWQPWSVRFTKQKVQNFGKILKTTEEKTTCRKQLQ